MSHYFTLRLYCCDWIMWQYFWVVLNKCLLNPGRNRSPRFKYYQWTTWWTLSSIGVKRKNICEKLLTSSRITQNSKIIYATKACGRKNDCSLKQKGYLRQFVTGYRVLSWLLRWFEPSPISKDENVWTVLIYITFKFRRPSESALVIDFWIYWDTYFLNSKNLV